MKKYVIIGLIIAVAASIVLIPLFKNQGGTSIEDEEIPAEFMFKENLATKFSESVEIEIQINNDDIAKLELIYNDSLFETWLTPLKNIKVKLNPGCFGLGTRNIQLLSTMKDGSTFTDNRMVRVLSDVVPQKWMIKIEKSLPHNTSSFTQGLEFSEGKLYESTGQKGQSLIAQVDLNSGDQLRKIGLDATYFGEGISILGNKIYQLTWQEQKLFVYNKTNFQLEKDIPYVGEGWGLCNDGKSLIMSNGSERITFRSPETFAIEKTIEVYDDQGPIANLNELEYSDNLIYANVWMSNTIVVIDPSTGKVIAKMDGTELLNKGRGNGDVLNGIAFNPVSSKWYMTGKNWEKLFEVKIEKKLLN